MMHIVDEYLSHVATLGRADTTLDIYRRRLRDWINSPATPGTIGASLANLTADRIAGNFDRYARSIERDEAEVAALCELVGELAPEPISEAELAAELRAMKEGRHVAG